jgi:hypothetical protein
MPEFPKIHADIVHLGSLLADSLFRHRAIFPDPPVSFICIGLKVMNFNACSHRAQTARAKAEAARLARERALAELVEAMKADLRYAENITNGEDDKLKLLGWSGKHSAAALEPPDPPGLLWIVRQSPGRVSLAWESSRGGGKPKAYTIQRRIEPGEWTAIRTAIITEATLVDQPQGVTLEYRVVVINKAGTSEPGNTVSVTL